MKRYKRPWAAAALLAVIWIPLGCNGLKVEATDDPPADPTPRAISLGYAGLYDVVSQNQGVNKLLAIKQVPDSVEAEINRIAATCRAATDQIEAFAETDPTLELDQRGIPELEAAARSGIENQTRQRLLFGSGDDLVKHLLLSQIKAMQYGRHMCQALAEEDKRDDRRARMKELAETFGEHETALLAMVGPAGPAAK